MKKRSLVFLFLLLALPLGIFAFLRLFGKNRFDLPVLHQSSTDWPSGCTAPDQWPFKVERGALSGQTGRPVLVLFQSLPIEASQRLPEEVDSVGVRVITALNPCDFGASSEDAAVLIDTARLVRGVYKMLDREEMDRLIMETKILLNDY